MDEDDSSQTRRRRSLRPGSARGGLGATSRLGPLTELPQVLRELGFAPPAVLADTGFAEEYFGDPDMPIPYVTGSRLLAHCAAVTGCEHVALLLGKRAGPGTLGLAGHLLLSADIVGSALQDLVRHFELHDRGGIPTLEQRDETFLIGFVVLESGVARPELLYDLAMTMACNIMRGLCGQSWNPTEVLLPRRPPVDATPWKKLLPCTGPLRRQPMCSALSGEVARASGACRQPVASPASREAGSRVARPSTGFRHRWRGTPPDTRHDHTRTVQFGPGLAVARHDDKDAGPEASGRGDDVQGCARRGVL